MTRRALIPASALLIAALAPAAPAAAHVNQLRIAMPKVHAASSKKPVIRSFSPKRVKVGQPLTIKGRNFVPGAGNTRVMFLRVNGKAIGVAVAKKTTRKKIVVAVPKVLNALLKNGSARFKLRVFSGQFSDWTKAKRSPVVVFNGSGNAEDPAGDCDGDKIPNGTDTDDDNDLLPDSLEGPDIAHGQIGTDPCNADSDGDGISDGFEYQSALDLNRTVLFGPTLPIPYPGKRPYPNALDPDQNFDYDGDGLTQGQEYFLWRVFGGGKFPLNYSDGLATTVPTPLPAGRQFEQMDATAWGPDYHDGFLNDGERDADGDGLTNWDEFNGRMQPEWWKRMYDGKSPGFPKETPYPITFDGTKAWDKDSDGDGVPDGLDDQDHDGLTNLFEVNRPWNWEDYLDNGTLVKGTYISVTETFDGPVPLHDGTDPWARVQPFNPCKPVFSKTCHRHPPFGYYPDDEDWEGMFPADAAATPYGPPREVPGPIFRSDPFS
jgi:hypothetical protein